jgi:hypothetical protein
MIVAAPKGELGADDHRLRPPVDREDAIVANEFGDTS